jgi:hypothetical protein
MYVDSYPVNSKSLPIVSRSPVSKSIYQSWSEGGKESYRTTIVNKIVSDIRRSLTNANLFKPFNKRHFTNEVDGYACVISFPMKMIYFEILIYSS